MDLGAWGVDHGYWDAGGQWREPPQETLDAIASTMGVVDGPPPSGPPLWFVRAGHGEWLRSPADLVLEDGTTRRGVDALPPDLPPGYHDLVPLDGGPTTRLVISPGRCHLPPGLRLRGTDWDLRWIAAPPPHQPGEERVRPVEDVTAVQELLTASSPTASALPGDPAVRRWVGVRDASGTLVACAADTSGAPGAGHLPSIAVRPEARGQGLGRAVTAALVRQLLAEGNDLVTLGMYADNASARAVYDALGFADEHRFTSGPTRLTLSA